MCSADISTNILTLPSSSPGNLTKPTSRRSCRTFISIYPVQPEDWIHSIIATFRAKMPTKPTHCWPLANRTMLPFSSHRNIKKDHSGTAGGEGSDALVLPLWSYATGVSDDVDWDMLRASSSDVSEFTEVALSFVNTLTEQATETEKIRTFLNQKLWVDRTIRDAVNHHTAAYNDGILSGNMSEYKASCYTLRRVARVTVQGDNWVTFQLNESRRMWQGLKTICSSGNNSSTKVRAYPLGWRAKHLLRPLWMQWRRRNSADQRVRKQQTEQQSFIHPVRGRGSEGTKESERQESSRTWWDYWPYLRSCADQLAGFFTIHI